MKSPADWTLSYFVSVRKEKEKPSLSLLRSSRPPKRGEEKKKKKSSPNPLSLPQIHATKRIVQKICKKQRASELFLLS